SYHLVPHLLLMLYSIIHMYILFPQCNHSHQPLCSFPTRRSSDLGGTRLSFSQLLLSSFACLSQHGIRFRTCLVGQAVSHVLSHRSEEHTAELQSRFDLVCRLLLEKNNGL